MQREEMALGLSGTNGCAERERKSWSALVELYGPGWSPPYSTAAARLPTAVPGSRDTPPGPHTCDRHLWRGGRNCAPGALADTLSSPGTVFNTVSASPARPRAACARVRVYERPSWPRISSSAQAPRAQRSITDSKASSAPKQLGGWPDAFGDRPYDDPCVCGGVVPLRAAKHATVRWHDNAGVYRNGHATGTRVPPHENGHASHHPLASLRPVSALPIHACANRRSPACGEAKEVAERESALQHTARRAPVGRLAALLKCWPRDRGQRCRAAVGSSALRAWLAAERCQVAVAARVAPAEQPHQRVLHRLGVR